MHLQHLVHRLQCCWSPRWALRLAPRWPPHRQRPLRAQRQPLAAALLLLGAAAANAGSWDARGSDGQQWLIVEDATRARDGFVLERRHADGRLDTRFGNAGSVIFSLGAAQGGPADLKVDAAGRPWVAGHTAAPEGQRAVLLRFLPDGKPDTGFAAAGRVSLAPRELPAHATDLLPSADGSAWVGGQIFEPTGHSRSGAWRVGASGKLDTGFAQAGLWLDPDAGDTEIGGLLLSAGGVVALGVRRNDGNKVSLETWAWPAAGGAPQRAAQVEARTAGEAEGAVFVLLGGVARWVAADGVAIDVAPAALLNAAGTAGAASNTAASTAATSAEPASSQNVALPYTIAATASGAAPGDAVRSSSRVWWAAVAAAALSALVTTAWWWRRRR